MDLNLTGNAHVTPNAVLRVTPAVDLARGSAWYSDKQDVSIEFETECDGPPMTTLTVAVSDQAKLRGILSKIWDLNLTVISVAQIESQECKRHSQPHSQRGGE